MKRQGIKKTELFDMEDRILLVLSDVKLKFYFRVLKVG